MNSRFLAISVFLICLESQSLRAATWTAITAPGATQTYLHGIDSATIAGNTGGGTGVIYSRTTGEWRSFRPSDAAAGPAGIPWVFGCEGNKVVGSYQTAAMNVVGFIYDGTTLAKFNVPGVDTTWIYGMSGSKLVGTYYISSIGYGYIYDGSSFSTWTVPGARYTYINGIDGNRIVGTYTDSSYKNHGFYYDFGGELNFLDMPGTSNSTWISGINGSNLVGYANGHGFLYNINTHKWTTLDMPGVKETFPRAIYGDTIVGSYTYTGSLQNGFIYTIPEPTTLLLLGVGAVCLRKKYL